MAIYSTGPNPTQLAHNANKELNKLYQWCLSNRLTINTNKTHYMLFKTNKIANSPNIHTNNQIITTVSKLNFLGVYYDYFSNNT